MYVCMYAKCVCVYVCIYLGMYLAVRLAVLPRGGANDHFPAIGRPFRLRRLLQAAPTGKVYCVYMHGMGVGQ